MSTEVDAKPLTEEEKREKALNDAVAAAQATNKTREGKGLRLAVSSTRGKNPVPVTYESFDTDDAKSLPDSVSEFMQLSGIDDEAQLVAFLITGYNDNSFRIASDPVAEYVNLAWPAEVQKSFKDSVKTLVKSGVFADVEAAVAVIRPATEAKFGKTA